MIYIKLYFSAGSLIIAIAAAAATKLAIQAVPYYYVDSNNVCQQTNIDPPDCVVGGLGCIREVAPGVFKQIYDVRIQIAPGVFECQQPLREF
jgi:hypothetical protein